MGKARWHPQLAMVLGRECHAYPFAKVGRTAPQVHCNVKHLALRDPYQLAMRMLNLVVQTTQHALGRAAVVVLHKLHVQPGGLCEVALIEAFKKEAAGVSK